MTNERTYRSDQVLTQLLAAAAPRRGPGCLPPRLRSARGRQRAGQGGRAVRPGQKKAPNCRSSQGRSRVKERCVQGPEGTGPRRPWAGRTDIRRHPAGCAAPRVTSTMAGRPWRSGRTWAGSWHARRRACHDVDGRSRYIVAGRSARTWCELSALHRIAHPRRDGHFFRTRSISPVSSLTRRWPEPAVLSRCRRSAVTERYPGLPRPYEPCGRGTTPNLSRGAARPRLLRFLCALGLTAHPVPTGCRLLASARAFGPSFDALSNLATIPRSLPHVATVLPPGCHSRRGPRDFFG